VSTARGQDPLEELIGLDDPVAPDRLIRVVGDRQGIVEVDLAVAVGQGRPSGSVDNRSRPVQDGAVRLGPPPEVDSSGSRDVTTSGEFHW
jgi:hypothetical protein